MDKANVLETSQLWRKVVSDIGEKYKSVKLNHMYVDNAAMQLVDLQNNLMFFLQVIYLEIFYPMKHLC